MDWVFQVTGLPETIEIRLKVLPSGLRDHIERSRVISQELAILHGVDARSADIGTAAHDLARAMGRRDLLAQAKDLALEIGFVERYEPILLHGPVAARWLAGDKDLDEEALEAVAWHTTGRTGMSDVAKVVFLADKLDPRKVARFPYLAKVAEMSKHSIDVAILEYLDRTIEFFIDSDSLVHPMSIEFRNELLVRTSE